MTTFDERPATAPAGAPARPDAANRAPRGRLRRDPHLTTTVDTSGLVDVENGLLDRTVYSDETLYRQELRRVFAPSWLFLAHTDQLRKPGDFFTTWMGEDPIIVVKDREGRIRAFLNSCRHKGARVCRADAGASKNFTCTYHGWAWDTSGDLVNVPNENAYPAGFDRSLWGLLEVPQVQVYRGLVFGTWNPEAPSLVEALGGIAWYLDAFLDRDPEGTVVVGGVHKWVLKGNWKLAAEQFASDWYHVGMSHGSALMVMSPSGRGPKEAIANRPGRQFSDPAGHGAGFPVHERNRFDAQGVHEYYDYDYLRERLGQDRVQGPMTNGHATIFPNFSYLPVNGSIRVWHPKGPDTMEVWAWCVLDASMPEEVREAQRLHNLRTFGPTGIFEADDSENWGEVQAIQGGFVTESVPLNYQMGLGTETQDGVHPGTTTDLFSDGAARAFWRRWSELMDTPAWHEAGDTDEAAR